MVEETGRSLRGYLSGAAPLAQYANPLGFLPGVPVQNYDPMATYDQSTQEALRNLIQTGIEMGPQDLDPNTGQPLGRPGISDPAVGSDILSTYGRAAGYLQPGLPLPATYQTISDTIGDAAIVPVPNPHADLHTIYSPYDFQPWGSGAARDRPTGAQGYGFGQLGLWLAEKIGKTAATLGAEPLPLATEYLPRVRTDTFEAQSPQDFAVGDESMVSTEWNPWIPLGEEGWRPNLQGDTIGGPEVGVETPEQIMASNVAQALATQTPRGMPGSARVTPELQALVELAQTDPTIAERYTTPGSQDLIDIATQQESFANIPETPWTPQAPVIPDISEILKAYVPPPAAPEPDVETFEAPPPKPAPRRVKYTPPKKTAKRKPSQRAPKRTAVQKAVAPKPKPAPRRVKFTPPKPKPKTPVRRRKGGKPKVRRVSKAPRRPGGR